MRKGEARKRIKCCVCGKIRYQIFNKEDVKELYWKSEPCSDCEKNLIYYLDKNYNKDI